MFSSQLGEAYNYGQPSGGKAVKQTQQRNPLFEAIQSPNMAAPVAPQRVQAETPAADTQGQPQPQRSMGRPGISQLAKARNAAPVNTAGPTERAEYFSQPSSLSTPSLQNDQRNYEVGQDVPNATAGVGAQVAATQPQAEDPRTAEIKKWYGQYLGGDREVTDAEIAPHLTNPNGMSGVLSAIQNSPEATQRQDALEQAQSLGLGQAILGGAAAPPAAGATGAPTTPALDSSGWDTDGWGTPQYLGTAAGGPMAGWDQTNWDDPNMQTPKYVVGRILSNYTPSMEGLAQAMAEIQKAYPGAEFDGKDKITIPGLGTIDALVNAGGDNMSWAWQDLTNDPGTSGQMGGPGGGIAPPTLDGASTDPLQSALLGDTSKMSLAQLLQLIQEEQARNGAPSSSIPIGAV